MHQKVRDGDNQPIEFTHTPLTKPIKKREQSGPQHRTRTKSVLFIFHRLCAFANTSTTTFTSSSPKPPSYTKMAGAAAGSRVADVLHKTVTTGLIVITIAGVADVVRGFGVLTKRNIDRRSGGGDDAGASSAGGASSREE